MPILIVLSLLWLLDLTMRLTHLALKSGAPPHPMKRRATALSPAGTHPWGRPAGGSLRLKSPQNERASRRP